ncbi:hypothetical protein JB92DRAFT_3143860 [Gautieria morchelliformis]|nr:hypothetical protein JB92DRAFT_3143860 [Gautieria morchelliformis]
MPPVLGVQPPDFKPHPWATTIFSASGDDKENDLPDASALITQAAAVKSVKGTRVTAPNKQGSAIRGGKPSVRGKGTRATAKRKKVVSGSDTGEEEPVVKRGHTLGAVKWRAEDFDGLLDLVEELLPAGEKEWLALYGHFVDWAEENERPLRSAETIEKWYKLLVCTSKPTGSAECPLEVERAHAIEHLIKNRVASGVVRDEDLDDEVIEISSDDSRKAARDDGRQARRLETLHLHNLTSQLREAEAEAWSLRKEVHTLQREVDRESRRADNAERDLHMYQMIHGQSHPVSHRPSSSLPSSTLHSQEPNSPGHLDDTGPHTNALSEDSLYWPPSPINT